MPPSPSPPPQQLLPAYRHFCRVCGKGFTCGSALGGHMRAHGVGDDGPGADEDDSLGRDDPAGRGGGGGADGAWDAAAAGTSTHVYALRANPNRLTRSCQVCKNCGKEFSSWELFLEHGKCNSGDGEAAAAAAEDDDDAEGSRRSSSPLSEADGEEDPALAAGWSKGKRSRRAKLTMAATGDDSSPGTTPSRCPAGELEAVNNLLMLSSSKVKQPSVAEADQESSASASKDDGRRPQLLQPISFVAPAPEPSVAALPAPQYVSPVPRGVFECKACKKVFTSHQALGGHRASHKKVKGCFAAKMESNVVTESETPRHHTTTADANDYNKGKAAAVEASANGIGDAKSIVDASTDGETIAGASDTGATLSMAIMPIDHELAATAHTGAPYKKKTKMHECSVCHRLFTSGQALGGHKRCHWLTSSTADHANLPALAAEDLVGGSCHQLTLRPMVEAQEPTLDLTIAAANPSPAAAAAMRAEVGGGSLQLDATFPAYFQPPVAPSNASHRNRTTAATSSHDVNDASGADAAAMEDEADSTTAKRAKLSDLKDVNMAGETTPWLQVGLGSSSAGDGETKSNHEPATTTSMGSKNTE